MGGKVDSTPVKRGRKPKEVWLLLVVRRGKAVIHAMYSDSVNGVKELQKQCGTFEFDGTTLRGVDEPGNHWSLHKLGGRS